MNIASRAAKIGARIRHHMSTSGWAWRYPSTLSIDDIDSAALTRLRADQARACRWLELASATIGLLLPAGNGSGGPWQRIAVVGHGGAFGILDIAAGRIAWTDTDVPSYVMRFAVGFDRGVSPSQAGGSGGMGSATAQIALTYGMHGMAQPPVRIPHPSVVAIEWGLTTCYGTCGGCPTSDDYRNEWARLVHIGVPLRETTEPQWSEVRTPGRCSVEIARAVVAALPYHAAGVVDTLEYGVDVCGVRGEGLWRVYGLRVEREHGANVLLQAHAAVAAEYVRVAAVCARYHAGLPTTADDRCAIDDGPRYAYAVRAAIGWGE